MAGEIKNGLPKKSIELLNGLAKTVKKSYYSGKTPDKALSFALKSANEHLGKEIKEENVNWLGNLNFAACSLKDSDLSFTLAGDIKIILIRQGEIINIGKNLNLEGMNPYPLKIFLNVASGKTAQNDILIISTKDLLEFIKENGVLSSIAKSGSISEKKIKELLPHSLFSKGQGSKISGACLIFIFGEEKKNAFRDFFQKESLKIPKISNPFVSLKNPAIEKLKPRKKFNKAGLIVLLIVLLASGFFLFKNVPARQDKTYETLEQKFREAEGYLVIKEPEKANALLKEILREISDVDIPIREKVKKHLETLNPLEEADLKLELKLEESGLGLDRIFCSESIYFYKKGSDIIIRDGKEKIELLKSVSGMSDGFVFSGPETLVYPDQGLWKERKLENMENGLFFSYFSNLYFIDKCKIKKYSYLGNLEWSSPQDWLNKNLESCSAKSFAVDGSIWILNEDNTIDKYYAGAFQQKIYLDIYPFINQISKIETNSSLPYLLISDKERIIFVEKSSGRISKQVSMPSLVDFSISGNTLYIFNGSEVFSTDI